MNYILPFLSVLLGFGLALWLKPSNKKNIKLLLAFSGSFLLSLTVIELLPEIYTSSDKKIGLLIMVGILFQIILEFFSKGAEHGHVHGHEKISQIPIALFISLCLHAFLEGFPVNNHPDLAVGIAIHHLPIAVILTTFFIQAQLNKKLLFIFMLVFAMMTPLGTLLAHELSFLANYTKEITAVVVGILFHISSTIIFESSEGHKFNLAKISMIIAGIVLAFFV
jgi:zinc transporter ZupT